MLENRTIAVIGGTGKLGSALAARWRQAGLSVIVGTRDPAKGKPNAEAAAAGDIVVLTVPFEAQASTLAEIAPHLAGKVLVDTTVPLAPPKVMRAQLPPEGCAAIRTQQLAGEEVQVISAFHTVAAHKLAAGGEMGSDTLVFGDLRAARDVGVALAEAAGLRGLHGGALANSAAAEAMVSVLIFMNKHHRADGAGLAITGIVDLPEA